MLLKRTILALSIVASFGLIACDDSSTGPDFQKSQNTPASESSTASDSSTTGDANEPSNSNEPVDPISDDKPANSGDGLMSCKIVSTANSFEMTMTDGDTTMTSKVSVVNDVFSMISIVSPAGADFCDDADPMMTCSVNGGIATTKYSIGTSAQIVYNLTKEESVSYCNTVDGMTKEEVDRYEESLDDEEDYF